MQIIQHDTGVILRHSGTPQILLIKKNQLPIVSPERHFWQSCAPVNATFLNDYGLKLITIRPLKSDYQKISDEHAEIRNVYLMRYLDGALPDNARWISLDEMPDLDTGMIITKAEILSAWQADIVPDWYHYDWYDTFLNATESITEGIPEQIRSWERSTIWRIPTKDSNSYFKAFPKMFAHEAALTNWLSQQFPEKLPQLLPSPIRGTIRTADYGQVDLMSCKDLEIWRDAIRSYAQLQIATITQKQALLEMDVPQRGIDWIAERMESFLMDDAHLTRGERPLSEDEISKLRSALPELEKAIATLRESPIPETLEHGDLWGGQLIVHEENVLITDWSDSAITFPFLSVAFLLTDIESSLPDIPDVKSILENAYLEEWLEYGDLAKLREILADANLVSNIYTALRYHHDILPEMGHKWEMHNMIAYDMGLLIVKL